MAVQPFIENCIRYEDEYISLSQKMLDILNDVDVHMINVHKEYILMEN